MLHWDTDSVCGVPVDSDLTFYYITVIARRLSFVIPTNCSPTVATCGAIPATSAVLRPINATLCLGLQVHCLYYTIQLRVGHLHGVTSIFSEPLFHVPVGPASRPVGT
jgi:hypothetical protein